MLLDFENAISSISPPKVASQRFTGTDKTELEKRIEAEIKRGWQLKAQGHSPDRSLSATLVHNCRIPLITTNER